MNEFLFWLFILSLIYCYLGYPLLVWVISHFLHRAVKKTENKPLVSVILSVFNEEAVAAIKIENLLSLDYPSEKLEILVGSDGSTDKTVEILKRCSGQVRFLESKKRRGKSAMLNDLVRQASGEILIFTDARQMMDAGAIKELVANFADPEVGCVSGELVFQKTEGATAKGVGLYWSYEKFMRYQESRIHSMLGATGAIYAIRRELFNEIPVDVVLDDMWIPLKIIQNGYRAVYDASARAYDEAAKRPQEEYRRKVRTLFGNYQIFALLPGMLNPLKSPVAVQLISHKLLRLMAPFFMFLVFLLNGMLYDYGDGYRLLFGLQAVFYVMGGIGWLAKDCRYGILEPIAKVCYIPYVFCLLNFAALMGFVKFIGRRQRVTWQKAREA